jgi:GAF domain-containing protein
MRDNPRTEFKPEKEFKSKIVPDEEKTREQLAEELALLRQRVAELEAEQHSGFISSAVQNMAEQQQTKRSLQESREREQHAIERERFIARIAQNIRQFLDLSQILNTTVAEVRRFLQVDRVVIYRFLPNWDGQIVAESVSGLEYALGDRLSRDHSFGESMLYHYRQGRIHWINDVSQGEPESCYTKLLAELDVQAVLVIPILVKQELWGLLAAHHCTGPRQWQEFNWLLLQQLSTQLAIGIHQAELYQQIRQQAQREQALSQVIQDIRHSLDLNTIFAMATSEVGQLLQLDRAEIVQYLPDQHLWLNVASYRRDADLPNALGLRIPDENNEFADRLKQGEVVQVAKYSEEADTTNRPFVQNYPGSWLLVPLEVGNSIWGSLSLNHRHPPWHWQEWEVDLACAVASQLAIAIQQSELYTEIQELNEDLEQLVEFRTAQLQQSLEFESLLKRITDRVRDSLDEQQILQSAVAELTHGLKLLGCNTALYGLEQQSSTVYFEYINTELPSAKGRTIRMAELADVYTQLLRGQPTQFCHSRTALQVMLAPQNGFAILACPMIDNREVVGDLWLFKPADAVFDPLEIRLAQQVANQCAIALRQSRLYQAAQAQVEELGRLNRLKDDFLSTVSHELRTPISSIKMATQMLEILLFGQASSSEPVRRKGGKTAVESRSEPLPTLSDVQKVHHYFHILRAECDRETRLINDLLDLSRLDAGTEPLLLSTIDPKIWIAHLSEPFVELAHTQQQQLEFNLPDHLPELTTDLSDLERIVTELLTNACKYTPAGERIIVSVSLHSPTPASLPSSLLLRITNTGVEILEQERHLIFEKFYRIPNNDPWKYGGTGLGLALVKKLLSRLNGTIQVESGSGQTTFTVHLPLKPEASSVRHG